MFIRLSTNMSHSKLLFNDWFFFIQIHEVVYWNESLFIFMHRFHHGILTHVILIYQLKGLTRLVPKMKTTWLIIMKQWRWFISFLSRLAIELYFIYMNFAILIEVSIYFFCQSDIVKVMIIVLASLFWDTIVIIL